MPLAARPENEAYRVKTFPSGIGQNDYNILSAGIGGSSYHELSGITRIQGSQQRNGQKILQPPNLSAWQSEDEYTQTIFIML